MNRLVLPAILLAAAVFAGCDKDDSIRTYQVGKQLPVASASSEPTQAEELPGAGGPIRWVVPAGWTLLPPTQMRYAGYGISPSDPRAMLTVSEAAGSITGNVVRWENQIGLPPTPEDQIPTLVQEKQVGGEQAGLVDLVGKPKSDGGSGERIHVVIVPHGEIKWFIKMSGSSETVAAQLPNFDAFVGSVQFRSE